MSEQKRTYPYVSANVRAELKSRFQKSLPGKVTPSYLQSGLGFESEKAAKNLIPQLRAVGLIDGDGVPTELAQRFRMDSDYAKSVEEIVASIYPDELRNLYPGPDEDQVAVANWFMRDTSGGQSSALIQARFYLSLVSGKLPASERPAKGATKPTSTTPKPTAKPTTTSPKNQTPPKLPDDRIPPVRAGVPP